MAAMEHRKRSKAAMSILEHRGSEYTYEREACYAAQALSQALSAARIARVRSRAASRRRLPRTFEDFVKQTTA